MEVLDSVAQSEILGGEYEWWVMGNDIYFKEQGNDTWNYWQNLNDVNIYASGNGYGSSGDGFNNGYSSCGYPDAPGASGSFNAWYDEHYRGNNNDGGYSAPNSFGRDFVDNGVAANPNDLKFQKVNGQDYISYDNGASWEKLLGEVTIHGKADQNMTAWDLGWEWLTGVGPRDRTFVDGDLLTEQLKQHSHIEDTKNKIRLDISQGIPSGENDYNLSGVDGVPKYFGDYSNLISGGNTGNLAVTYLGSYDLKYVVNSVDGDYATVTFTVNNASTIASATHPPVIGYTPEWNEYIGTPLNDLFSQSGAPMSQTTQTFIWTENIKWR
ncbi:hypothetical protein [Dyadobacter psychrotolerans]|uniref:Uncharacterized protein n=1 Tax=Dyadobacter psychrotolerans TaxID=2541721 RepID=A0A4R5DQV1_9BACT|nr:hypothetical protein [Dyadobacter psychrotolerans]TDE13395.1 hypothetical protein E0F88_20395 [Dyadobacter psychrotolerans]